MSRVAAGPFLRRPVTERAAGGKSGEGCSRDIALRGAGFSAAMTALAYALIDSYVYDFGLGVILDALARAIPAQR